MFILLVHFALSDYDVYDCNITFTNYVSGRLYSNPGGPICSNTTYVNLTVLEKESYGYLHTKDIKPDKYLNLTYINSNFSAPSKEILASTGSAHRDIYITFINCTIWRFFRDYEMQAVLKEISFINCILNLTQVTEAISTQGGSRGVIFGAQKIAFKGCKFVGKVKDEKHPFIRLAFDNNVDGYTVDFTDCVFDMDTDYNMKDGVKSNTRQFLLIDDMLNKEERKKVVVNFVRCTTGNTLKLREDPLHLIRIVTTQPVAVPTDIWNSNIKINEGTVAGSYNGIGIAFSVVDNGNKAYSDEGNTTWLEAFKNKHYERTATPKPGSSHSTTPTVQPSGDENTTKKEGRNIPWKTVSFIAAGLFVVTLIVLIITCVKKKKKYDRSE